MKPKNYIHNPFQYGIIVKDANFCNRVREISELKSHIKNKYSVWLYSPRRFGKTSLIHKTFSELKGFRTVYIDLYNIKSLDDFCKKYASQIASNLFSWKQEIRKLTGTLSRYFSNLHPVVSFDENGSPSFSLEKAEIKHEFDVETILNIPHKISQDSNLPICIAFDEFQEIKRIEPFLINWMRSAFQHHENISYIFSGSQQSLMEMIFANEQSPFYEFATKMHIDPIDKENLEKFVADKFNEKEMIISQSKVREIVDKAEQHPHFTQYFASVAFELLRDGVTQDDINFSNLWMEKILQGHSVILQGIYDQLTNIQRKILKAIADLEEGTELYSSETRKRFNLPISSSMVSGIESLIKKGLILKEGNRYKIVNPILKAWLHQLS